MDSSTPGDGRPNEQAPGSPVRAATRKEERLPVSLSPAQHPPAHPHASGHHPHHAGESVMQPYAHHQPQLPNPLPPSSASARPPKGSVSTGSGNNTARPSPKMEGLAGTMGPLGSPLSLQSATPSSNVPLLTPKAADVLADAFRSAVQEVGALPSPLPAPGDDMPTGSGGESGGRPSRAATTTGMSGTIFRPAPVLIPSEAAGAAASGSPPASSANTRHGSLALSSPLASASSLPRMAGEQSVGGEPLRTAVSRLQQQQQQGGTGGSRRALTGGNPSFSLPAVGIAGRSRGDTLSSINYHYPQPSAGGTGGGGSGLFLANPNAPQGSGLLSRHQSMAGSSALGHGYQPTGMTAIVHRDRTDTMGTAPIAVGQTSSVAAPLAAQQQQQLQYLQSSVSGAAVAALPALAPQNSADIIANIPAEALALAAASVMGNAQPGITNSAGVSVAAGPTGIRRPTTDGAAKTGLAAFFSSRHAPHPTNVSLSQAAAGAASAYDGAQAAAEFAAHAQAAANANAPPPPKMGLFGARPPAGSVSVVGMQVVSPTTAMEGQAALKPLGAIHRDGNAAGVNLPAGAGGGANAGSLAASAVATAQGAAAAQSALEQASSSVAPASGVAATANPIVIPDGAPTSAAEAAALRRASQASALSAILAGPYQPQQLKDGGAPVAGRPAVPGAQEEIASFGATPIIPRAHLVVVGDHSGGTSFSSAGVAALTAAASVDAHVADRAGRTRRTATHAWSLPYRSWRWVWDRVLTTVQFWLVLILISLGLLFLYVFPDKMMLDNSVYAWLFLFGASIAVLFPLQLIEWAFFKALDGMKQWGSIFSEAVDFANSAKGHLAYIGALVFALLLKYQFFQLQFDNQSSFYFNAAIGSLIFLVAYAFILYKLVLKIILRTVYTSKHRKRIEDCLFHVESARFLTAPTPLQLQLYSEWLCERAKEAKESLEKQAQKAAERQQRQAARIARQVQRGAAAVEPEATAAAVASNSRKNAPSVSAGPRGFDSMVPAPTPAAFNRPTIELSPMDSPVRKALPSAGSTAAVTVAPSRQPTRQSSRRNIGNADDSALDGPKDANPPDEDVSPPESPPPPPPPPPPIPIDPSSFASLQRVGSPTYLLDSDSFWTQLAYVRSRYFSMYSARGRLCDVASAEAVEQFAKNAFERLYGERLALERLQLKRQLARALARDHQDWIEEELRQQAEDQANDEKGAGGSGGGATGGGSSRHFFPSGSYGTYPEGGGGDASFDHAALAALERQTVAKPTAPPGVVAASKSKRTVTSAATSGATATTSHRHYESYLGLDAEAAAEAMAMDRALAEVEENERKRKVGHKAGDSGIKRPVATKASSSRRAAAELGHPPLSAVAEDNGHGSTEGGASACTSAYRLVAPGATPRSTTSVPAALPAGKQYPSENGDQPAPSESNAVELPGATSTTASTLAVSACPSGLSPPLGRQASAKAMKADKAGPDHKSDASLKRPFAPSELHHSAPSYATVGRAGNRALAAAAASIARSPDLLDFVSPGGGGAGTTPASAAPRSLSPANFGAPGRPPTNGARGSSSSRHSEALESAKVSAKLTAAGGRLSQHTGVASPSLPPGDGNSGTGTPHKEEDHNSGFKGFVKALQGFGNAIANPISTGITVTEERVLVKDKEDLAEELTVNSASLSDGHRHAHRGHGNHGRLASAFEQLTGGLAHHGSTVHGSHAGTGGNQHSAARASGGGLQDAALKGFASFAAGVRGGKGGLSPAAGTPHSPFVEVGRSPVGSTAFAALPSAAPPPRRPGSLPRHRRASTGGSVVMSSKEKGSTPRPQSFKIDQAKDTSSGQDLPERNEAKEKEKKKKKADSPSQHHGVVEDDDDEDAETTRQPTPGVAAAAASKSPAASQPEQGRAGAPTAAVDSNGEAKGSESAKGSDRPAPEATHEQHENGERRKRKKRSKKERGGSNDERRPPQPPNSFAEAAAPSPVARPAGFPQRQLPVVTLDPAQFYCPLPKSLAEIPDVPDVTRWEYLSYALRGVPCPVPIAMLASAGYDDVELDELADLEAQLDHDDDDDDYDDDDDSDKSSGRDSESDASPTAVSSSARSSRSGHAREDATARGSPASSSPSSALVQRAKKASKKKSKRASADEIVMPYIPAELTDEPPLPLDTRLVRLVIGEPLEGGPEAAATNPQAVKVRPHMMPEVMALEIKLAALASAVPTITIDDVRPCFTNDDDALAAFRLLDTDVDGVVTKDEFVNALVVMFKGWAATQSAVASFGGISGAISILCNIVRWISTGIFILIIFQVSVSTVLLPISTFIIAVSFAVGPTIQRVLDSLVFTLIMSPFEIGDRVAISNVAANATLVVSNIFLYTTEFVDGSNRLLVMRNSDMMSATITNLRRSGDACASIKIVIDGTITSVQIAAIKEKITDYCRRYGVSWKPKPTVTVTSTGPNTCDLNVFATHRSSWQEWKLNADQAALIHWLMDELKSLGIVYRLPNQSLDVALGGTIDAGLSRVLEQASSLQAPNWLNAVMQAKLGGPSGSSALADPAFFPPVAAGRSPSTKPTVATGSKSTGQPVNGGPNASKTTPSVARPGGVEAVAGMPTGLSIISSGGGRGDHVAGAARFPIGSGNAATATGISSNMIAGAGLRYRGGPLT